MICPKCKEEKIVTEFREAGTQFKQCTTCRLANREKVNRHRDRVRDVIRGYKVEQGCATCDENREPCLRFVYPDNEERRIGSLMKKGLAFGHIYELMKACAVMCANCSEMRRARRGEKARDHI